MYLSKMKFTVPVTAWLCLVLFALLAGLSGCGRLEPIPPLKRRVAVLDFRVPESTTNESEVRGWWFGARTILRNTNDGKTFANVLSQQLLNLDYLEQVPRTEIKYYMSKKKALLQDEFDTVEDLELEKMLLEVSPVDYGLEMGVDQVITGRVVESFVSHQRTIHTWYARFKVEVDLYNMSSGEKVWTKTFEEKEGFSSTKTAMQKVAVEVMKAINSEYYQKQNVIPK